MQRLAAAPRVLRLGRLLPQVRWRLLIQENNHGSTAATFRQMIEQAVLDLAAVPGGEPRQTPYIRIYYLSVMRGG